MISKKTFFSLKKYTEFTDELIDSSNTFYEEILRSTGEVIKSERFKLLSNDQSNITESEKILIEYITKTVNSLDKFNIPEKRVQAKKKQLDLFLDLKDEL